jgi:trans-aconitate 2-methyltransferase
MAWNPDTYNKFKDERFMPFYDLLDLIKPRSGMEIIDLGCGTGELTRKLADAFPDAIILGIDTSAEMLSKSKAYENNSVRFECRSIENETASAKKYDLVFSNAALQWVENHELLTPKIISMINPGGQLTIQMPAQHHNISNRLLNTLADEEPFRDVLKNWKRSSPVLEIDEYAKIFFENGSKSITAYEKIYPLVLPDSNAVYDWVSGTALIPYIERLEGEIRQLFIDRYKALLKSNFDKSPAFYPFKRILLEATF